MKQVNNGQPSKEVLDVPEIMNILANVSKCILGFQVTAYCGVECIKAYTLKWSTTMEAVRSLYLTSSPLGSALLTYKMSSGLRLWKAAS